MRVENLMIGLVILVFCLGLSIIIPDVLTVAAGTEDIFRLGFGTLGLFAFVLSLVID